MANSIFHELNKRVSSFLRDTIKTARLAITDVTPEELLTEEATSWRSHMPPDIPTMKIIAKAAFDIDQFERIVHILHHRFSKFERKRWRAFYNALVLLEHLTIHGPLSVCKEFSREDINKISNFHYVDKKGFDWGLRIRKLCDRISKLLEEGSYLKEERREARSCIIGFGSFSHKQPSANEISESSIDYGRSNSLYNDYQDRGKSNSLRVIEYARIDHWRLQKESGNCVVMDDDNDHPFCENENGATVPLIS